jgi:hypothetical protein
MDLIEKYIGESKLSDMALKIRNDIKEMSKSKPLDIKKLKQQMIKKWNDENAGKLIDSMIKLGQIQVNNGKIIGA